MGLTGVLQSAAVSRRQLVCRSPAGSRSTASAWPATPTRSACCRWYVTCRGRSNSTCACPSRSLRMTAAWWSQQKRRHIPIWVRGAEFTIINTVTLQDVEIYILHVRYIHFFVFFGVSFQGWWGRKMMRNDDCISYMNCSYFALLHANTAPHSAVQWLWTHIHTTISI